MLYLPQPYQDSSQHQVVRQVEGTLGHLFDQTFNLCLAHDDAAIVEETLAAWKQATGRVAEALASNDPATRLRGKPMRPVFQVRSAAKKAG